MHSTGQFIDLQIWTSAQQIVALFIDRSSPNLEHSFPLQRRHFFRTVPKINVVNVIFVNSHSLNSSALVNNGITYTHDIRQVSLGYQCGQGNTSKFANRKDFCATQNISHKDIALLLLLKILTFIIVYNVVFILI